MRAAEPGIALRLDAVSREFDGAGIHDVSMSIAAGEFVAIVGPSGAGKSTLLNVLGLLDSPTSGTYRVFGTDVSALSERQRDRLRSHTFGFVFQNSFVLGDHSALRNAALGLRIQQVPLAERAGRASDALTQFGLSNRAQASGWTLSGGEQQRLALARAMATRPRVLLADEPTGNLDSANGERVLTALREIHRDGVTVVLITHDPRIAAAADRRIHLRDGATTAASECNDRADTALGPSATPPRHRWTAIADILAEAVGALTGRLLRTLFLVLAFALGVGGLVASLGVAESAAAQVGQRLSAAALHDVRVGLPGGGELFDAQNSRLSTWVDAAAALPHVRDVGVVAHIAGAGATVRRIEPGEPAPETEIAVLGASPSYLRLAGARAVGPDRFDLLGDPAIHNVAVIGSTAAEALGVPEPGAGSTIWVGGRLVTIVGGYETGSELDSAVVVSEDVARAFGEVSVSMLVRTEWGYPATVADALPVTLDPGSPGDFSVETVADLRTLRFGVTTDLDALVALIAAVLLGLATVSAATTLQVSVLARAPEIALRRALGASRGMVGRLFLAEGTLIGLLGGAIGAATGTALCLVIAAVQGWSPVVTPELPLVGVGLGAVTGLVSAVIPAWAASRRAPAEALRGR